MGSRYYDPQTRRFINPDNENILDIENGGFDQYNLSSYCFNNSVNMYDNDGQWPKWVNKAVAAVVAVVTVAVAVTVATAGAGSAAAVIAVGAAKGAAVGMVSGAATGAATGAVAHRKKQEAGKEQVKLH